MYLDEYKRWMAAELEDADLKPFKLPTTNILIRICEKPMGGLEYSYDVTRTDGKNVFCFFSSFTIQSPILSYTFV